MVALEVGFATVPGEMLWRYVIPSASHLWFLHSQSTASFDSVLPFLVELGQQILLTGLDRQRNDGLDWVYMEDCCFRACWHGHRDMKDCGIQIAFVEVDHHIEGWCSSARVPSLVVDNCFVGMVESTHSLVVYTI